jgi:asparagine synthase (glutamine-hydrolysing)
MRTADDRHVLVFNGEIYNHAALRVKLGGPRRFRGTSDTEVLLHALVEWGVDRALAEANGMFAFAFWDAETRRLTLARDRLGEKPLYLARAPGLLAFASDLAALREVPGLDWSLDRDAVADFLKRGYVSGGRSIHSAMETLAPATVAVFDAEGSGRECRRRYWSAQPNQVEVPSCGEERADAVEALLLDSIRLRSFADVPVGAFLSGGIDSSLVVALMRQAAGGDVHTFSIGFEGSDRDEAPYARRVAEHLGTRHTEVYLTAGDALAVVPKLPDIYSEPFADPSQIPTSLVCSVARRDVTVCLSGDGGDELFAGYERYARTLELWRRLRAVPAGVRRLVAAGIGSVSADGWERTLRTPVRVARRRSPPVDLGHKVRRLGDALDHDGVGALYDALFTRWPDAHRVVPGARPAPAIGGAWKGEPARGWMSSADLREYLPDDILVKVDRASMAVSLEARVPMLDHRLVEIAFALPEEDLLVDGVGKQILRRILARHVPPRLFERPKVGFGVPVDEWLRGPLRDWADDLLDRERLASDDLLDPDPILARWRDHRSGARNWEYSLWTVLMLQQWRERWC